MQNGIVKSWDNSKGYGFIVTEEDDELFVNVNDLHASVQPKTLREGQKVRFDVKFDIKGDRAVNVRITK
ncbi:MAG: cold shock domain-containing protein [Calditrichae bacterium]|nr:cold shock domain-containing protein [Calditrichota bacterium]MCB9056986.1 cold shock domain-containing protein [Calditrichia bacterium]